jgi:hypothetical protein
LAGILQILNNTIGWIFIAQGRTRELFHAGIYNAVTILLSFAIGVQWGAVGLAAAYALSDWIVRAPVAWWLVNRIGPIRASDMIALQAPLTISAAATFLLFRFWISNFFEQPIAALIISMGLSYGLAAGLLASAPSGRARLTEVWRIVIHLVERAFARSVPRELETDGHVDVGQ